MFDFLSYQRRLLRREPPLPLYDLGSVCFVLRLLLWRCSRLRQRIRGCRFDVCILFGVFLDFARFVRSTRCVSFISGENGPYDRILFFWYRVDRLFPIWIMSGVLPSRSLTMFRGVFLTFTSRTYRLFAPWFRFPSFPLMERSRRASGRFRGRLVLFVRIGHLRNFSGISINWINSQGADYLLSPMFTLWDLNRALFLGFAWVRTLYTTRCHLRGWVKDLQGRGRSYLFK